jgi:oligopeptide/dipeptide ABC transporter ATP-binding protein
VSVQRRILDLFDKLRNEAAAGAPLDEIPGRPVDPGSWSAGCRFAPRCVHAADVCRSVTPEARPTGLGTKAECIRLEEIGVPS